jgi:hypothetical protein
MCTNPIHYTVTRRSGTAEEYARRVSLPYRNLRGKQLAKVQDVLEIENMEVKPKGRDEIGRDPYETTSNAKYGEKRRSEIVFDL